MNFKIVALLALLAAPAFAAGPGPYGVQNTVSAAGVIADCAASAASGPSAINTALAVQFAPSAFLSGSISGGGVPAAFNTAAFQVTGTLVGSVQFATSIDGVSWNLARALSSQAPPAIAIFATGSTFPLEGELLGHLGARWGCVYVTSYTSGSALLQLEPSVAHTTLLLGADVAATRLVATDGLGRFTTTRVPVQLTGAYRIHADTGSYAGLGAGSILISLRYAGGGIAVFTKVRCYVTTHTAATAAGRIDRALFVVRSYTVADTGGTAVSLASPAGKLRSTQSATGLSNLTVFGGSISAGTGTQDTNPIGVMAKEGSATEPVGLTLPAAADGDLFSYTGDNYPLVLAPSEGLRITIPTAMPATLAQRTSCTFEWFEPSVTTGF